EEGRSKEGHNQEGRSKEGHSQEGRNEEGRGEEGCDEEVRSQEVRSEEARSEEVRSEEVRKEVQPQEVVSRSIRCAAAARVRRRCVHQRATPRRARRGPPLPVTGRRRGSFHAASRKGKTPVRLPAGNEDSTGGDDGGDPVCQVRADQPATRAGAPADGAGRAYPPRNLPALLGPVAPLPDGADQPLRAGRAGTPDA